MRLVLTTALRELTHAPTERPDQIRRFRGVGSRVWMAVLITALSALPPVQTAAAEETARVLSLKDAVQLALKQSPTVLSAEKSANAAVARVAAAKSAGGFTLGAAGNYNYVSKETSFFGVPVLEKNTLTESLVLQKPIYSGGKIRAGISQARFGQKAAGESAAATRDAVTERVADAYYRALMAKDGIGAAQESVNSLQASRDAAEKLRAAGVVTKADVLRADAELAAAKEQLITSQNDYATALAALKTTIGLDQSVQIQLSGAGTELTAADLAKIQPKEPHNVTALRAALAAAEAQIKVARSGNRPQVFLEADALNIAKGAEFPRRSNTLAAGLSIRLPIFDSGATRANVAEASSMRDKTAEDLRAAEQASQLEIESAKLELNSAIARQETTGARVSAAEESLRVLQAGYREGITPLTDVLAAQAALVAARFNRISTNFDVQMAQVRLLTALGRADLLQQ